MTSLVRLISRPPAARMSTPSAAGVERRGGNFEKLCDPGRIAEIIAALARYRARGTIRNDHHSATITARDVSAAMRATSWDIDAGVVTIPAAIEVVGFNSVYHIPVERGYQQGSTLVTSFPDWIHIGRRRWLRRVAATSLPTTRLMLANGAILPAVIRDLSYEGLSLAVRCPDLAIGAHVEVELGEPGAPIQARCEVRSSVPRLHSDELQLGLRVLVATPRHRWIDLVNRELHPGTQIGSALISQVWALYERCGYFELSGKRPEDFAQLGRAFVSVSRQLDRAPHIGVQAHWPAKDGETVVATATALKVYSGTWLGLQMAKDSGDSPDGVSGRRILRELNYRMKEHMQLDPDFRWFCTYVQAKKVWTRFVFHDGMQRFKADDEAAFIRFQALEVPIGVSFRHDDALTVQNASEDECARLADLILLSRCRAYADAFDLTHERIDLAENKRSWNGARLERDRAVLIAQRSGQLLAAAVLEAAADGLHLFGLLDLVRLYPLAADGASAYETLLATAAQWFAARGKERFCILREMDVELAPSLVSQMTDLGEADMCLLAARRVPDLLELIRELTAPRATSG